jgi:hypothetical protein
MRTDGDHSRWRIHAEPLDFDIPSPIIGQNKPFSRDQGHAWLQRDLASGVMHRH